MMIVMSETHLPFVLEGPSEDGHLVPQGRVGYAFFQEAISLCNFFCVH